MSIAKSLAPFFSYTDDDVISKYRMHWIIFYVLMLIVNIVIYFYLVELEEKNCDCGSEYREPFKNVVLIKMIFMVLEIIFLFVIIDKSTANIFNFIASSISFFFHLPVSFMFLWSITKIDKSCACTDNWKKMFMYLCFF